MVFDDQGEVTPDGLVIRRMRRGRGWSRRAFIEAIADACVRETGLRETISPQLLEHIEETSEPVPYETLCRIAAGLDCNPVELVS
jgi:transcriptional regulator with XRE-family HTH domain